MANGRDSKPLTILQEADYEKLLLTFQRTEPQQLKFEKLQTRKDNINNPSILSVGCMSKLKEIYIREKYHKQVVSIGKDYSPAILNGVLSENKSLNMVSELDGVKYRIHKGLVKDKFLKGILDAFSGNSIKKAKKVMEIKTCQNMQSLVSLIKDEEVRSNYYWQLMGYLAMTGADEGEICHCVVTYPERIINDEIQRFLHKVKPFGFDGEYIDREIERIRFNLSFDEIPIEQRVVRFSVSRNDDDVKNIREKVKTCRKWLNSFDKIHSNLNIDAK
jgi:hypothetical protein